MERVFRVCLVLKGPFEGLLKITLDVKMTFKAKAGFKKALRGFSAEAPKPDSGSFSGRFGSDSGGPPHCNADFWTVTPTFGL